MTDQLEVEKKFKAAQSDFSNTPIDLSMFTDSVLTQKAQAIDSLYRKLGSQGVIHPLDLERAQGSIINLRNLILHSQPNELPELRQKFINSIKAFDLATGRFPENFDLKTGTYKK